MPATRFVCPSGNEVPIRKCLASCPEGTRCLLHPTLSAIAASTRRKLRQPSVTELIIGTREAYLKKTTDYAIDPQARLFALGGSAMHAAHAGQAEAFLSEARFHCDTFCGQIDLYGDVLGDGIPTLADLKTVGSYKALKALGLEAVDVETGEVYKTGERKGQPKTRKEWVPGGRREVREWALQLNAYRYLLEREGFPVGRMVVQLLVRDAGLEVANRRGIDRGGYLIEINRISDRWIERYFKLKSRRLYEALWTGRTPGTCRSNERWQGDRKCRFYCEVRGSCDYAQSLISKEKEAA